MEEVISIWGFVPLYIQLLRLLQYRSIKVRITMQYIKESLCLDDQLLKGIGVSFDSAS